MTAPSVVPVTSRRAAYRAGSPWVWGHHRSASGIRISPVATIAPDGPAARSSDPRVSVAPAGPSRTTATVVGRSPPRSRSSDEDRHDAGAAVEPRTQPQILDDEAPSPLQGDRAPRPDGGRPGREARNATQQHRPEPAQVVVRDQPGPPAGPGTALGRQLRGQRSAADRELVVAGQEGLADVDDVLPEHRLTGQDRASVQERLGERGDPSEPQDDLLAGGGWQRAEARPEPPILGIQVSGRAGSVAEGAGRGPGHARRDPGEFVEIARGRPFARRRGCCLPAVDDRDQVMAPDPASDGRGSERHAVRRRLRRARRAPRSRPGSGPSSRRSDRTAAGGRA